MDCVRRKAQSILPKHKRDVSDIENKVLAMYARGMSQRDISATIDERKEILGLWIQESESKHAWMQIFDELKARGVQEVGFISMDGA